MKYSEMPLSAAMHSTLAEIGYETATPIQVEAIPNVLEGHDIIGQAQTGTGKTAAFAIPTIEQLQPGKLPQVLVLVPTRELALQVTDEFRKLSAHTKLKTVAVYGGESIDKQFKLLRQGADIIVGTPGRVIDHIVKRRTLKTDNIRFMILDEVGEMLSMGFIDDVETILEKMPEQRQTLFFSATMPQKVKAVAEKFLNEPVHIAIKAKELTVENITQYYVEVRDNQKLATLVDVIRVQKPELAIVFARTKRRVDEVMEALMQEGFHADRIHGDLSQEQRTVAFRKFKARQTRILIATDVAARGLDIQGVSHVYNYDLPQDYEYYVHRIGRTGRAGLSGQAISFVTPKERKGQLPYIEKKTKATMERMYRPSTNEVIEAVENEAAERMIDSISFGEAYHRVAQAKQMLKEYDPSLLVAAALHLLTPKFDKEAFSKAREDEANFRGNNSRRARGMEQHPNTRRREGGRNDRRRDDRNGGDRRRDDRRRDDRYGGGDRRRSELSGAERRHDERRRDEQRDRDRRNNRSEGRGGERRYNDDRRERSGGFKGKGRGPAPKRKQR